MVSDRKLANAVGGKSTRACDNCVRKRASWYCAADDAFLCQSCDSSVHSANPLARRHERVRLKTITTTTNDESWKEKLQISVPTWHQGFTRKARTPRTKKHESFFGRKTLDPVHDLVPEMCSTEEQENDEQLLYRVPIFDPSAILPSELDLSEFESFLGEDDSIDMEGLGILDCGESGGKESKECSLKIIKFEENYQIDLGRETFELNFDSTSPITYEEEGDKEQNKAENQEPIFKKSCKLEASGRSFLKLDYEGVMSAWDDQKSPWTTGERPELNPGDCLVTSGSMHVHGDTGTTGNRAAAVVGDGGREARVSRYREKRRTRLFSKKIRYEVRKLNAEKRPRMKGRFVKRANLVPSAFPLINN